MADHRPERAQNPPLPRGYAWASDLIREEREREAAADAQAQAEYIPGFKTATPQEIEQAEQALRRAFNIAPVQSQQRVDQNVAATNQITANVNTKYSQYTDEELRIALLRMRAQERGRQEANSSQMQECEAKTAATRQEQNMQQQQRQVQSNQPPLDQLRIVARQHANQQMQHYRNIQAQQSPASLTPTNYRDPRNWGSAHWMNRPHARQQRDQRK